MTITLTGCSRTNYCFETSFTIDSLKNEAGIYAILNNTDGKTRLLDIGCSKCIGSRVRTHERTQDWHNAKQGKLEYAALYIPNLDQHGMIKIEEDIRTNYPS